MLTRLIVIQPINLCNLNCSYCYVPGRRDPKRMSPEILEATIRCIYNSSILKDNLTLVWHAGEPLSAGLDFYQLAVNFIKKYNINNIPTELAIQTNATLIDDNWCNFFIENDINVSISIDGPKFIHDKHRLDWKNKGSFDRVLAGMKCLQKNGILLSAICVLTNESLDYPDEMYRFFLEHDFKSLSFNIDEIEGDNSTSSFNQINGQLVDEHYKDRYLSFMSRFYDLWVADNRKITFIREFTQTEYMLNVKLVRADQLFPSTEVMPLRIITVTKNGNVSTYSPELSGGTKDDPNQFIMGNVKELDSLDDLILSPIFKSVTQQINQGVVNCLNSCKYFDVCGGGSPSNKFFEAGSFEATETSFCILTTQLITQMIINKYKTTSS